MLRQLKNCQVSANKNALMTRNVKSNLEGFSLVEAVVASLIFATVVVGVFATMASFKRPSVEADKKLMAAYYGKQILEDLRAHVDQRTWGTGLLSPGPHPVGNEVPFTIYNPTYNVTFTYQYNVVEDPVSGSRQVLLNIEWPD